MNSLRGEGVRAQAMQSDVGLIGLGTMGSAIARRMLEGGHKLTLYDVSVAALEPFLDGSCRIARSPVTVESTRCLSRSYAGA